MDDDLGSELEVLFERVHAGDDEALSRLVQVVYEELRRIARGLMHEERRDHTLGATALVNEAWLRLLDIRESPTWENRRTFFAGVTTAMRHVLSDHARRRHRAKRGGGWARHSLQDVTAGLASGRIASGDIVDLHEKLDVLSTIDPRAGEVVRLKALCGLTIAEAAQLMGVSHGTVEKDWKVAKAWLSAALDRGGPWT